MHLEFLKIRKILSTTLKNENKGMISNIILQNYPYTINDVCYNPKKKEIIIALENGTVQILSHFKNFPEYIISEYNPNNSPGSFHGSWLLSKPQDKLLDYTGH